MTTIAADSKAGVMCSDSFWFDDVACGFTKKVYRIRGELLGGAGSTKQLDTWFKAYRKNGKLAGNDVLILRLSRAGISCWNITDGWHPIEQRQFAIGTGAAAARGAMAAGVSCRHAVRLACDIDANTGGPIRTYRLGK